MSIVLLVFALLFLAGILWGLWQPTVRVSKIQVFGADNSFAAYAQDAMRGTYLGIIPRNSIFFIPEHAIRARILAADTSLASVSIFREGFTGITIRINERTAVGNWCGLQPTPGIDAPYCYVFDANGFIFAAATTSQQVLVPFTLYDPLAGDTQEPLQATLAHADVLPATFDLAREISAQGASVKSVVIRGDEVDDLLVSGTRITYVLGQEQDAFTALTSAKNNLNLTDGSIDYVDLRFPGKVYVKPKPLNSKVSQ